MKKKYNYKYLYGIIIGLILSCTIVVSATYSSSSVYYRGNNLNSTTVQGAIDELAEKDYCPSNNYCLKKKTTVSLGDYVHYVPEKSTASIAGAKTGYTTASNGSFTASVQTFSPSELTLWRVLNINQDGSVDIISVETSSATIYFGGLTGYLNLVGTLNEIACEYANANVTSGCRHFGYSNQTQVLSSGTQFTTLASAPWECETGGSCSPAPVENQGGGDTGYLTDYNQLKTAFNTSSTAEAAKAYRHNTTTYTSYWTASRYYYADSATYYLWCGRSVKADGALDTNLSLYYHSFSIRFYHNQRSNALRPIVTLKSGLSYSGWGLKEYPMEIVS